MPYNIELPDGRLVTDIPDNLNPVEAKAQLISMQFCDQELQRLQSQAAALQTARQAYAKALQASLAAEAIQGDKISFN